MKILHLMNHLNPGGISSYVYTVACEMNRRGHQSFVLSSEGSLAKHFQAAGIKVSLLIPKTKSEMNPRLYLCLSDIQRFVAREGINLLHAHTRVGQVIAAWIKLLTGISYVTTCHAFYKRRLGRRLFPAWGNHVIAISDPVRNLLIDRFCLKKNEVTTIFNGIDMERLQNQMSLKNRKMILRDWGISASCPIVISAISRIVPIKGHEILLNAVKQLIQKYPNLHLIITGEGPHKKHIEKITHGLHLGRNVTFTGALEDITRTMAVTDIFVSPILWNEAFGLSIAEAMALKIPVVTTTSWSLKDVYKDRDSVLLVEPGNVLGLTKALEELIVNNNVRHSIAEKAYCIVKEKFSIESMGEKIEKLYKRVFY
ncbi:MAG: glycosyltransferase family 4 protein [Candidatus Omnitrophica bacterium]|nr:glycosyltransferase family 4 protein [Candidatus Omnitrophota bacterium]